MKFNHTQILTSVLAVAVISVGMPHLALAQSLADSVTSVQTGIKSIPQIVAGAFYIGGAALIGAGALKLKAHSESPTQTPLGHGLGRLVAGSALIAIPAFSTWLNASLAIGSTNLSEGSFGTVN